MTHNSRLDMWPRRTTGYNEGREQPEGIRGRMPGRGPLGRPMPNGAPREPWPGPDLSRIVPAPALWRSVHLGRAGETWRPPHSPPVCARGGRYSPPTPHPHTRMGPGSAVVLVPDPATALPCLLLGGLALSGSIRPHHPGKLLEFGRPSWGPRLGRTKRQPRSAPRHVVEAFAVSVTVIAAAIAGESSITPNWW
jgi:hypothetical protein